MSSSIRNPQSAIRNGLSRREMCKLSAAGVLGVSLSGWLEVLAGRAADVTPKGKKHKSCILLWMDGGPSQHETFDPKPDAPADVRGEFGTIDTSVPGIRISDRLPRVAKLMQHAAILRGMSTPDNNHATARVYMHTGFKPLPNSNYPTLGSLVSSELGNSEGVMPNFVVTGVPTYDSVKFPLVTDPGYLGTTHAPLIVNDLRKGVENLSSPLMADDLQDRLTVLEELEKGFRDGSHASAAAAHRATVQRAVQLTRSKAVEAFDLTKEPAKSREAYGDSYFGQGCLLARRLVEVGVPFVEVYLPDWDTHFKERFERCKKQSLPQLDVGLSALITDLKQRGMLKDTLVVWMGEFGRTPKVNNRAGRDRYARAWSSVLFGGEIKTGQVVGKTDKLGGTVEERPVNVPDFMATVCKALGIDHTKEKDDRGRPVRIVDKGAKPVPELFV